MTGFLDALAKGYYERYYGKYEDISMLTFILPNKRSGSFLMKSLKFYCKNPTLGPRIITISELVEEITGLIPENRLSALFVLFQCYKDITGKTDIDFDSFSKWGETVLQDFNEIDMQIVEAEEIYKNLNDFNSINTSYLTDEQKEVIERFFGCQFKELEEKCGNFWKNFNKITPTDGKEDIKGKYIKLWQIFPQLYGAFNKALTGEGTALAGHIYRRCAEMLTRKELTDEPLPGQKLVFAGFNVLTESERRIFKAFQRESISIKGEKEPKADFIWDKVSEKLAQQDDPAVRFVEFNMSSERFPSPEWMDRYLEKSRPSRNPDFKIISVPSNVMQVKVISKELEELSTKVLKSEIKNARIAVVLPDENLLLPLLYSLPKGYATPNLTMGFPMKHTSVVSFVGLIRKLQARTRLVKGEIEFYYEDVKDILAHPYSQLLFEGQNIREVLNKNDKEKRITVSLEAISKLGYNIPLIFRNIRDVRPQEVLMYIDGILKTVRIKISEKKAGYLSSKVEITCIDHYRDALVRLDGCISRFEVKLSAIGIFRMAERLISTETVPFEGEPLQGLQIMGLLETRALDFDYVIIPSMNEELMPRRGRTATFIPNVIRGAYGMPPANYQEDLFAYYFFRLIGRCRNVTLTYDARTKESRSGSVSRYILQLIHLVKDINIQRVEANFGLPKIEKKVKEYKKDKLVEQELNRYFEKERDKDGYRKNFSASAMMKYCTCPLQFLFLNVLGEKEDREQIETIDPITLGKIVHEVIERLYSRKTRRSKILLKKPVEITKKFLEGLLSENTPSGERLIDAEVKRAINKHHFGVEEENLDKEPLRGTADLVIDNIVEMVEAIVIYDIEKAPFGLYGCEIKEDLSYVMEDGRMINTTLVIDRLDVVDGKLRIVDYKTGYVHLKADSVDNVFDGDGNAKNIFQLGFYARILHDMIKKEKDTSEERKLDDWNNDGLASNIEMVIYNVLEMQRRMLSNSKTKSDASKCENIIEIGKEDIRNLQKLIDLENEEGENFDTKLEKTLAEIMDVSKPFISKPSEENCRYCGFQLLCDRLPG